MSLALGVHTAVLGTGGASLTTGPLVTTPGSTVVLCATWQAGGPFVSFVDSKGNVWTPIQTELGASPITRMYYAENIVGGAGHTFTINITTAGALTIFVVEILGAKLLGALDQSDRAADFTSPFDSPAITTTENNEFLVGFMGGDSGSDPATHTALNSFTLLDEITDGVAVWPGVTAYRIVSSIAAYSSSFTEAGATLGRVWIASFKEAAAGSAVLFAQSVF